jgi:hypothetical protein
MRLIGLWLCVLLVLAAMQEPAHARSLSFQPGNYGVDYDVYHTYQAYLDAINTVVESMRGKNVLRRLSAVEDYAHPLTALGNDIVLLRLTDESVPKHYKVQVFLTFGEHPRELVVVESCLDLLRNLTEGWDQPCDSPGGRYSRHILRNTEILMVGVMNPDGKQLMEQKSDYCQRTNANGVDLNRNMPWEWGGPGSSDKPHSEEYRGTRPFSEVETQLLPKIIDRYDTLDLYMSIHSGEQQVFIPFVDTKSKANRRRRPGVEHELELVDLIVRESDGWFRNGGIAYELNEYTADGSISDWVAGKKGVEYVFVVETWGGPFHKNCFVQFNPESHQLEHDLLKIRSLYTSALVEVIQRLKPDLPVYYPLSNAVLGGAPTRGMELYRDVCEAADKYYVPHSVHRRRRN